MIVYGRQRDEGASGVDVLHHAVDVALTVLVQTEWLASRPMIPPIVAAELDVPAHVKTAAKQVSRLADDLDRILESDILMRRHESDVVDAVFVVAVNCRLFATHWSAVQDAEAGEFNSDLRRLRGEVDLIMRSLRA